MSSRAACVVWVTEPGVRHLDLLSREELGRLGGLLRVEDRHRFVAGAGLLRLAVAHETGADPRKLRIRRSCPDCPRPHGKPTVVDGLCHVSVSHSADRVLVAVTTAGPIGVDVEARRPFEAGLAAQVVGAGERAADLLRAWVRKEAVVKATGEGLRVPLGQVVVGGTEVAPVLASYRGQFLDCVLHDLDVGAGYAAALAVLTGRPVAVDLRPG